MTQKYKSERQRASERERNPIENMLKSFMFFSSVFVFVFCLKGTTNVMPFQFNFMLRVSTVKYNVMELV